MLLTAAHELTHFIRDSSPSHYEALKEFVTEKLVEQGYDFDYLVKHKMQQNQGIEKFSEDTAIEEVVADACEMVLKDSKAVQQLAEEKPSLFKRIRDWLKSYFSDIKKAFVGVEARHEEAKAMTRYMDELVKLWDDAFAAAAKHDVGSKEATGKRSDRESPYDGKSLYKDKDVYDYEFLISQPAMLVHELPPLSSMKNNGNIDQEKVIELGLKNASIVGREVSAGIYAIKNRYTGREIIVGKHGLDHSLGGENIKRLRTNARLSSIGGLIVQNAIPINGLKTKNQQANGTYAMAYLAGSGDRYIVAIVTVEEHSSKVTDIDYIDITHSINGRLTKNGDSRSSTGESRYNLSDAPATATSKINIADFLEIVNNTHRSILSDSVLRHYNQERPTEGYYTGSALYSLRDSTAGLTVEEAREQSKAYTRLKAENAALQRRLDYWKGQSQKTKQASIRKTDTDRYVNQLLKQWGSKADRASLQTAMQELGNYLVRSNGESLSYEELHRIQAKSNE